MTNTLTEQLSNNANEKYREFSKKLIPDTDYKIIGVRTPIIKNIAKNAVKTNGCYAFLTEKHELYEEYFLHGIILGYLKTDFFDLIEEIEKFLPYIDNWAICDSTVAGLKIFKKHPDKVLDRVKIWIKSENPYTVRFGIVTLLDYYLDDNFSSAILELVANIKSEHYYIKMAAAWFFSIALIKRYESTISYLTENRLEKFVHNKSIQKAMESYRINDKEKVYLKTLKIK